MKAFKYFKAVYVSSYTFVKIGNFSDFLHCFFGSLKTIPFFPWRFADLKQGNLIVTSNIALASRANLEGILSRII